MGKLGCRILKSLGGGCVWHSVDGSVTFHFAGDRSEEFSWFSRGFLIRRSE